MGRTVHNAMGAITYFFLGALVFAVGLVVLVVVGPILLEIDILADPTYTKIEDFLRRMLLYIVIFAIGYIIASWGRRLSEPKGTPAANGNSSSPPSLPRVAIETTVEATPKNETTAKPSSSHSYRPEVVPPTHP